MDQFQSLAQVSLSQCALTIGAFDGVHLGHQKIIEAVIEDARQQGAPSVVLTFYPHPSVVLRGRRPSFYLTSPDERADRLGELGVDVVVTETFDEELSRVPASDYLERLKQHLGFRSLWVGSDFALGHQREGTVHYLRDAQQERDFELHVVEPVRMEGEVVSSTRIREALRTGDVARAAAYLGRWFSLPGEVEQGAGRGKQLGIPTANLSLWRERAFPRKGVYACLAQVEDRTLEAVTNVGVRPTFDEETPRPIVETHLLDFEGDLYGQTIRLHFVDRLRDEKRFDGPQQLLQQIERDIERARQLLTGVRPDRPPEPRTDQ